MEADEKKLAEDLRCLDMARQGIVGRFKSMEARVEQLEFQFEALKRAMSLSRIDTSTTWTNLLSGHGTPPEYTPE